MVFLCFKKKCPNCHGSLLITSNLDCVWIFFSELNKMAHWRMQIACIAETVKHFCILIPEKHADFIMSIDHDCKYACVCLLQVSGSYILLFRKILARKIMQGVLWILILDSIMSFFKIWDLWIRYIFAPYTKFDLILLRHFNGAYW